MALTDSHQGGRLEDMAVEGTTIPGDAGKQRLVSLLSGGDLGNNDKILTLL